MKYLSAFGFMKFLALLGLATAAYSQTIDPHQYVWLNYGKVSLRNEIPGYYTVTLPCEARVGLCVPSYDILPLDWKQTPEGDLLIPK